MTVLSLLLLLLVPLVWSFLVVRLLAYLDRRRSASQKAPPSDYQI